jgi:hypothetical protein
MATDQGREVGRVADPGDAAAGFGPDAADDQRMARVRGGH